MVKGGKYINHLAQYLLNGKKFINACYESLRGMYSNLYFKVCGDIVLLLKFKFSNVTLNKAVPWKINN